MPIQALPPRVFPSIPIYQYRCGNPYVIGGYTLTAKQLGMGTIDAVIPCGSSFDSGGNHTWEMRVNYPAGQSAPGATGSASVLLQLFAVGTNTEATAIDLSGEYFRLIILGG